MHFLYSSPYTRSPCSSSSTTAMIPSTGLTPIPRPMAAGVGSPSVFSSCPCTGHPSIQIPPRPVTASASARSIIGVPSITMSQLPSLSCGCPLRHCSAIVSMRSLPAIAVSPPRVDCGRVHRSTARLSVLRFASSRPRAHRAVAWRPWCPCSCSAISIRTCAKYDPTCSWSVPSAAYIRFATAAVRVCPRSSALMLTRAALTFILATSRLGISPISAFVVRSSASFPRIARSGLPSPAPESISIIHVRVACMSLHAVVLRRSISLFARSRPFPGSSSMSVAAHRERRPDSLMTCIVSPSCSRHAAARAPPAPAPTARNREGDQSHSRHSLAGCRAYAPARSQLHRSA